MTSIHPSSPLKNVSTTTYSPSNSPTSLRSPQTSRNSNKTTDSISTSNIKNWNSSNNNNNELGNGIAPRRPLSASYNLEQLSFNGGSQSSPEAMRRLGAGTGGNNGSTTTTTTTNTTTSEAIGERRRQSNSFKTMSTGSLVSNSPFTTNRLGSTVTFTSPPPVPVISGLYSNSYTPPINPNSSGIERKVSGRNMNRRGSGDSINVNTNENVGGPIKISSVGGGGGGGAAVGLLGEKEFEDITPPRSTSVSPSIPFRPVRNTVDVIPNSPSGSIITIPISQSSISTSPYKSNWGIVAPRQSSSYAASRQNALVSTSPFVNRTPSISNFHEDSSAPTSSSSRSTERERERVASPSTMSTFNSGMGLGIRPGGPLTIAERRIAGSSVPPPSTPPQPLHHHQQQQQQNQRNVSSSNHSPSSALALSRRGMKGPRAPEDSFVGEESIEFDEDTSRLLRRKPSAKTVTWSTTEEVLEFDVESERSRSSDISNTTTNSDSDTGGGGDASFEYDEADNSTGFEEGGSVVVHDVVVSGNDVGGGSDTEVEADDYSEEDQVSEISTASTVEDMMGEIEAFMDNVSPQIDLGPRLTFDPRQKELDLASLSHALPSASTSVSINGSNNQDDASSTYSDDEDALQADRAVKAASAMYSAFPSQSRTVSSTLSSSTATATLRPQGPDYSLPSLPSSSPLIGFTESDESIISSPATFSSSSTISPPGPSHSTPTKFNEPFDSPLASPFATNSTISSTNTTIPTHLSRHASILESEPYGSSLGSVRGSLRGGNGRLRQGREKFDEKVKAHKALLAEVAPSSSSFSSVSSFSPNSMNISSPIPSSNNSNYSPATSIATLETLEELPRIIQARPALKARTATISSDMLPNISGISSDYVVGGPLTAELANGMESPLDRLQRGVVESHLDELPSPLISTASAPVQFTSPQSNSTVINYSLPRNLSELSNLSASAEERNKEISSNRRKARTSIEDGRQWNTAGIKLPPRRRSLSTGDASYTDDKTVMNTKRATMPEAGFTQRLNSALPASESAFGLSVGSSLDSVYRNSQHPSYKVRERKKVVYANDGSLATIGSAGDVDPGRAWRKKRPSDMNLSMTSDDLKSLIDSGSSLNGSVFVSLVEAHFDDLPLPQESTTIICRLDNGRQKAEAGTFKLGQKIVLKKEFELSCSANLAFSIDLRIPISANTNPHLLPNNQPTPLPPTPSSPSKSSHRFLSAFSSPKKKNITLPPPSSPRPTSARLLPYLSPEGIIGSVHVSFKSEAAKCRTKSVRLELPFFSNGNSNLNMRGGITIDLFHIPSIAGILKEDLPKSVEEAKTGIALAEKTKEIKYEGILTQMGGDCSTWRRRLIRIIGSRIVPFNEITKKSYVEIDLSSVIAVEDPNAPISATNSGINRSSSQEFDEAPWRVDNSINLVFQDGDSILFFADTKEEKVKWMNILGSLAGKRVKEAPEWAIQLRKQQLMVEQ